MGPQVFLRMPVLKKDKSVRIEFMAFGGGWVDQPLRKAMEASPHTGMPLYATTQPLKTIGIAYSCVPFTVTVTVFGTAKAAQPTREPEAHWDLPRKAAAV
jgi:hypothetical protein